MGVGIWAMHFTGMLALKLGMPVTYEVFDTLLSMAVAIGAAALAFFVVVRGVVGVRELALAGPPTALDPGQLSPQTQKQHFVN